ncbi:MAG: hypothetical protein JWM99_632 [Verrucomicrobiales bacterium]|nr:hypothetical protein [Verrucomicrobiales bacterium]
MADSRLGKMKFTGCLSEISRARQRAERSELPAIDGSVHL